jgi:hypothetical protein
MKKTVFLLFLLLPFCYLLAQPPVPAAVKPLPFTSIAQPVDDHNIIADNDLGNKNVKVLEQHGNDNYVWVDIIGGNKNGYDKASTSYQKGRRNYADLNQSGNKNRFEIYQKNNNPTYKKDRNKAYVNQSGDKNEAIITQRIKDKASIKGKLVAKVDQSGDGNRSMQEQYGKKNRALVVQDGDKGVAKQWQGEKDAGNKAYFNSAVIVQKSKAKKARAYQYQDGFNNDASIVQKTDKSVAKQVQLNSATAKDNAWDDNVARITQRGNDADKGNRAYQIQFHDAAAAYPVGNLGTIDQKGSNNVAWQVQVGGKNVDDIVQHGDGNVTKTLQVQGSSVMPAYTLPFSFNIPAVITP